MLISVLSISTSFTAWWAQGQEIEIDGTYVSLSLDILVLLALSSRSAAAYARRNERPDYDADPLPPRPVPRPSRPPASRSAATFRRPRPALRAHPDCGP